MRPEVAPGLAWVLVCALVGLPAACLGWAPLSEPAQWPPLWQSLVLRPDAGWHQAPWVLWTTAWLHGSERHLWLNLLGLLTLAFMGWRARLPGPWALRLSLAWPWTHLALLLDPRLTHYIGASGFLHAGLVLWLAATWGSLGARGKWVWGLALAALVAKVAWEVAASWGGGPTLLRPGADVPLAVWAHVSGVTAGLLLAGIHGAQRHHSG